MWKKTPAVYFRRGVIIIFLCSVALVLTAKERRVQCYSRDPWRMNKERGRKEGERGRREGRGRREEERGSEKRSKKQHQIPKTRLFH